MALFSKKKNTKEEVADKPAKVKAARASKVVASKTPASKTTKTTKTKSKAKIVSVANPVPVVSDATVSNNSVANVAANVFNKNSTYDFTSVLITPRITEKATMLHEKSGIYTFNVHSGATKISVAKAIKDVYNVVPRKVRIVHFPAKQVFSRGKRGVKKGGKKAYVYLKAGEKIDVV